MTVLLLLVSAIIAYCLGSINGAIIAARFVFHKDVRDYGSGNAGLTNYFRTFGVPGMAIVAGIDIVKSVLAVLIGGALLNIVGAKLPGELFAGFCLIMGHIYPAFYQFRGGKGVVCAAVMAFTVDWRVGLCCLITFLVIVIFTRYVSLGSIIGTAACPLLMLAFDYEGLPCLLALFCALLVIVKHSGNIVRLIRGTESKFHIHTRRPVQDEDFEDPEQ